MRVASWGLLIGAGFVLVILSTCLKDGQAFGQRADAAGLQRAIASGQLIALSVEAGDGHQQVTLVDPKLRVMSVYHVDKATGEISLKSVRNFHWDLQMEDYNGDEPSPREIRLLLE